MQIYILLAGVLLAFLFVHLFGTFMRKKSRKEEEQYWNQQLNSKIRETISLQDIVYRYYQDLRKKAVQFEDYRAAQSLDRLAADLNKYIKEFNRVITEDTYLDEAFGHVDVLWNNIQEIYDRLDRESEKIKDLRESHHHTEKQREVKKRPRIPFEDSKYFRGCADRKELTKKYHQLVKLYHPDNGGDQLKFIQIKEEYKRCIQKISQA